MGIALELAQGTADFPFQVTNPDGTTPTADISCPRTC